LIEFAPPRQLNRSTALAEVKDNDDDYIHLSGFDLEDRLEIDLGVPKSEVTPALAWELLETLRKLGADVQDHSHMYANSMLLANPIGYYSINIKKTTWTLIGLILDVTYTMGAASAALAALGIIGQSIGRVREHNGELCVYRFLLTSGTPQTTKRITKEMPHSCFRARSKCQFRQRGKCSINGAAVLDCVQHLERIGAIAETSDRKWKTEL
jgi:hypothetical protein